MSSPGRFSCCRPDLGRRHGQRAAAPAPAPTDAGAGPLMTAIFAALAKETPWIAVVGAGLAGAAELFLNRNKPRK